MRLWSWVGLVALVGMGCRKNPPSQEASPLEKPDSWDRLEIFGLNTNKTWDQIKGLTSGEAKKHPWSDSYWPYAERGLSGRWLTSRLRNNPAILTPWEQLQEYLSAAESRDATRLAELSPAEKYDYLMSWAEGRRPSQSTLKALEEVTRPYAPTTTRENEQVRRARQAMLDAQARMSAGVQQGLDEQAMRPLTVAYLQAVQEHERAVQLAYGGQAAAGATGDRARELAASERMQLAARLEAPLQNLANFMPLFSDGWRDWATFARAYESRDSWLWVGHCHGWAAASAREAKPRHSVLARRKGHEILLTEGDIRALLTKLYADQPPRTLEQIGLRCGTMADNAYVHDGSYRVVDGVVCTSETAARERNCKADDRFGGTGLRAESLRFAVVHGPAGSKVVKQLTFRRIKGDRRTVFATLVGMGREDLNYAKIFDSEQARQADYESNKARFAGGQPAFQDFNAIVSLTKGCRGVNPMTVHYALTEILNGKGEAFTADVDRFGEVWNHAIHKYETRFVPLRLTNGTTFQDLIPVDRIRDPFAEFRAPETRYLVQVETTLWYAYENGPLIAFRPEDDLSAKMVLSYTLELDAQKKLIGGEWGHLTWNYGTSDTASGTRPVSGVMNPAQRPPAPDLIWRYAPTDRTFAAGLLDPNVIMRIHQCSLTEQTHGDATVAGMPVKYSVCDL